MFRIGEMVSCSGDNSTNEPGTWHGRAWLRTKAVVTRGFMPLLKTYVYVLDYVKDFCLFIYLYHRLEFIPPELILLEYMIYAHGASILTSGMIMGFVVQTNDSLLNLGGITSTYKLVFLRCIILLCTPLMAVVIVLRAVNLKGQKNKLVDLWRKNKRMARATSVSGAWQSYRRLEDEKKKLLEAFADLKMVECSLEAAPQLFFLIVFI